MKAITHGGRKVDGVKFNRFTIIPLIMKILVKGLKFFHRQFTRMPLIERFGDINKCRMVDFMRWY